MSELFFSAEFLPAAAGPFCSARPQGPRKNVCCAVFPKAARREGVKNDSDNIEN